MYIITAIFSICFLLLKYSSTSNFKVKNLPNVGPQEKEKYMTSLCNGRLGNILSAVATLYAYHKDFNFSPLLPRNLAQSICFYFECKEMVPILESVLPDHKEKNWIHFK